MRIAIIGANGFVGRAACRGFKAAGYSVLGIIRRRDITNIPGVDTINYVENAGPSVDWDNVLEGSDIVLHLVSPSEKRISEESNREKDRETIIQGSKAIVTAAAKREAKRVIFISSIKVNGEVTTDKPFDSNSIPNPTTIYGKMKLETEKAFSETALEVGIPITILRPPLVYGPGNLGNINKLIDLLRIIPGWLIPLSNIRNKRAMIFLDNLISALVCCAKDKTNQPRTFFVRDSNMVSTSELCQLILKALGKRTALAPDPIGIIRSIAKITCPEIAQRLYGSLKVENNSICNILGWEPPVPLCEGIRRTILANYQDG